MSGTIPFTALSRTAETLMVGQELLRFKDEARAYVNAVEKNAVCASHIELLRDSDAYIGIDESRTIDEAEKSLKQLNQSIIRELELLPNEMVCDILKGLNDKLDKLSYIRPAVKPDLTDFAVKIEGRIRLQSLEQRTHNAAAALFGLQPTQYSPRDYGQPSQSVMWEGHKITVDSRFLGKK